MKGLRKGRTSLIVSLLPAIVLLVSACASSDGANDANGGTTASPDDGVAPAIDGSGGSGSKLAPYEISIYIPGPMTKDIPEVEQAIDNYLKDKINATVKLNFVDWANYQNKTNLMITSGEKFDLMYTANWLGYTNSAAKGMFLPVDDLIEKYGPDVKPNLAPVYLEGAKVNGKLYGLPSNKEYASNQALLARKDLMDKYGFDSSQIQTYHDFTAWFQKIKENEPGIVPYAGVSGDVETIVTSQFEQINGDYFGVIKKSANDLKVVDMFADPDFAEILKQARAWYDAGYIVKDASTTQVTHEELMKTGKIFSFMVSAKPGIDKEKSLTTGKDLVQLDFSNPYSSSGDVTGALLAISNTAKDPERDMMFLNLLYSDRTLLNLIDWGIEGKHYVKMADNVIDFPQGVDANSVGYSAQGDQWIFGNQFNSYIFKTEDPQKWDKSKKFNNDAIISKTLGFTLDPTPVQNEISACLTTFKQYLTGLFSGTLDPDKYLPELSKKLKANGLDKIIAEKQKQLNAWAAAKQN